jgi:hypothetical protein
MTLVERLAERDSAVELDGADEPAGVLKRRIDELGQLSVRFTETTGPTTLAVTLDPAGCDLGGADLAAGTGWIHLEGTLTLDYVPVRCVADIDLATRTGRGRLLLR